MQTVKMLSLNVSMFDRNNDALKSFLANESPQLICLQEVTRRIDASAEDARVSKDAVDDVTDGLTYSFYSPNWVLKSFRMADFHGKEEFREDFGGFVECGNYTKSAFPINRGSTLFL